MKFVVYFVPRENAHPDVPLSIYDKLWPIMYASVKKLGHELVHLTDMATSCMGDVAFRVDVDPKTTVFSRDVAWLKYVESLPDGEQACMIEPDTLMLRDFPPLKDGKDVLMLRRPGSCIPGWFKLAKNTAAPLLREIVRQYDFLTPEQHVFHGDIGAMHRAVGIPDGQTAHTIPSTAHGVSIEVRDWLMYGFRKAKGQYFLQFKGTSKPEMLEMA